MNGPVLTGINLVAADVEASVAFYRRLGAEIPDSAIWRTASGPHHVTVPMPSGFSLEIDSRALAGVYDGGYEPGRAGGQAMIGWSVETREQVDALFADLTGAGHKGLQPPWDAFWGGRACVIEDPDGHHVGIQSPPSDAHRSAPPEI